MAAITLTWAGGEHRFDLSRIGILRALQQRCDAGPPVIYNRLKSQTWLVDDVFETIRLGLEGGGMSKDDSRALATRHLDSNGGIAASSIVATLALGAGLFKDDEDDPVGEASGEATPAPPTPQTESGASLDSTLSAEP